jgi:hypothetical protein
MEIEYGGGNQPSRMREKAIPKETIFDRKTVAGAIGRTCAEEDYHELELVRRQIRDRSVEWLVG